MDTEEKFIDLHTHSTASDGSYTPAELVKLASDTGLAAIALTDHDTTAGIPEFLECGRNYPDLTVIPGVELCTTYGARELHIVGLFIDHTSVTLSDFLEKQRAARYKRNRDMKIKLGFLGYPLADDEPAFADAGGFSANLGRPHFARALMEKYDFPDMKSVFDKLIGNKKPGYIPRITPAPAEAIQVIHSAGGIAVWAHPIYRDRNERAYVRRVARKLHALGLDALEGYYSLFGVNETMLVTEICEQFGLAVSGGSDFHGSHSPNIMLGTGAGKLRIPAILLDKLYEKQDMIIGELKNIKSGCIL